MKLRKNIALAFIFLVIWGALSAQILEISSRRRADIYRVIPDSERSEVEFNRDTGFYTYNYAYTDPITGAVISAVAVLAIASISALFVKDGSHA